MKLALLGLCVATVAHADPPAIVALAPAADARMVVALGPKGQVYEPDGKGAWTRAHGGGTAREIVNATRVGPTVIAGTAGGPPFRFDGVWTAVNLGKHAAAVLGVGSRPTAAVGRVVFALDRAPPMRLADAPSAVLGLSASATSLVALTDQGVFRFETRWKPVRGAPAAVIRLVGDRWALVDRGAFDLKTAKTIAWPADVQVVAAASTPDGATLIAAATRGTSVELLTFRAGKLDREPIAISGEIADLVTDREGRVVIASRDGHVAIRDRGSWTTTVVSDALPAPRPGPPPAISH